MRDLVLYIHGRGGSAAECEHYRALFPRCDVTGLDYHTSTPWEAGAEIREAVLRWKREYEHIILIANSIGAYFSMNAGIDDMIQRAFFISPVVDMEGLICGMMSAANVSEEELRERGVIPVPSGEELRWEYLCYVRSHPIRWQAATEILYGGRDTLTSRQSVEAFAGKHGGRLTVMEQGEHWFHTQEQMQFLDAWMKAAL